MHCKRVELLYFLENWWSRQVVPKPEASIARQEFKAFTVTYGLELICKQGITCSAIFSSINLHFADMNSFGTNYLNYKYLLSSQKSNLPGFNLLRRESRNSPGCSTW